MLINDRLKIKEMIKVLFEQGKVNFKSSGLTSYVLKVVRLAIACKGYSDVGDFTLESLHWRLV